MTPQPRNRQRPDGELTQAPETSGFEPREGLPDPESVEREGIAQHWRKHPSDLHADYAMSAMHEAYKEKDSLARRHQMQVAEIHALLSLRDAVIECSSTLKEVANRQIDSTQGLDETLKTATNAVVREMRKATLKEVA